jgi:hypothetical protein
VCWSVVMKVRVVYCCSRCGSSHFRSSISRRLADPVLACLGVHPQRCYSCRVRFYLLQPEGLGALLGALDRAILALTRRKAPVPAMEASALESKGRARAMVAGAGDWIRQ